MANTADRLLAELRTMTRIVHDSRHDEMTLSLVASIDALDAHLSAGGTPPEAWREGPDAPAEDSDYSWHGWEADEERPGVFLLTIEDPDGEEYATIVHRVCDGLLYPLNGEVALAKMQRADHIVATLNRNTR